MPGYDVYWLGRPWTVRDIGHQVHDHKISTRYRRAAGIAGGYLTAQSWTAGDGARPLGRTSTISILNHRLTSRHSRMRARGHQLRRPYSGGLSSGDESH